MAEFFTRSWFRRVWIVQEGVLSSNVCFMVGCEQFDIREVALVLPDMRELKSVAADMGSIDIIAFERMWLMRNSRSGAQATPSLSTFLMWDWSAGIEVKAMNLRDKLFAYYQRSSQNIL